MTLSNSGERLLPFAKDHTTTIQYVLKYGSDFGNVSNKIIFSVFSKFGQIIVYLLADGTHEA